VEIGDENIGEEENQIGVGNQGQSSKRLPTTMPKCLV